MLTQTDQLPALAVKVSLRYHVSTSFSTLRKMPLVESTVVDWYYFHCYGQAR